LFIKRGNNLHNYHLKNMDVLKQGSATGGLQAIIGPPDIISGPPDYSEVI
jgi:hypothetical protein